jgi:hypothetical protein
MTMNYKHDAPPELNLTALSVRLCPIYSDPRIGASGRSMSLI